MFCSICGLRIGDYENTCEDCLKVRRDKWVDDDSVKLKEKKKKKIVKIEQW